MKSVKRKKRKLTKQEFSKRWLIIIMAALIFSLLFCVFTNRMTEVCVEIVKAISAVFGFYLIKAFFGKFFEEKNKLLHEIAEEYIAEEDN